jgi:hypothetical protein
MRCEVLTTVTGKITVFRNIVSQVSSVTVDRG